MADTKKKDNFWKLIIWAIIALLVVPISGLGYNIYLTPNAGQETYASCKQKAEDLYAEDLFQEVPQKEAKQKDFENNILCADLAAQQSMSDRANWGLFIGIWGLIVLGITLWQTRKAARAASETLKIADDTLEITQNTAYKQLRAYPGVGDFKYDYYSYRKDDGSARLDVSVEIKNYAQTPAYSLQWSLRLEPVDYPAPDKLEPAPDKLEPAPDKLEPAPDKLEPAPDKLEPAPLNDNRCTLSGNTLPITSKLNLIPKDVNKLVAGKARVLIVVALEFSDYKSSDYNEEKENRRWERIGFLLPASPEEGCKFRKSHSAKRYAVTHYRTESSD